MEQWFKTMTINDYIKIVDYIQNNPKFWKDDRYKLTNQSPIPKDDTKVVWLHCLLFVC
jgi:hypothetical protein